MDAHAGLRLCYGHTTKPGCLLKMSIFNKDIVIEDINGLIICPNVQKSSKNHQIMQKNLNLIRIKNICFINQKLAGFEPTGKCPIDVLVKTI